MSEGARSAAKPAGASALDPICGLCGEPAGEGAVCEYCGGARRPGGFTPTRIVAQNPHSRVYEAVAPDGAKVALKELLFAQVPQAKDLDDFQREAKLLAELAHPDVPKFVRSFVEGRGVSTRLYLAQELVDGESLAQRLERGRGDEAEARETAQRLLPVLAYLHSREPPVVHRDVKPANVVRRPDGRLALVDFGAARDLRRGETFGATLVGTFGYAPLEQLGGTVDATSDLYALGMTLVHLVTGRAPAELATDELQVDVHRHVHATPAFVEWLAKLSASKRSERFQTAEDALHALIQLPPIGTPAAVTSGAVDGVSTCAGCHWPTTHAFACPHCDASLQPAGCEVVRVLSRRANGATYLARESSGREVVVREYLLRPEVDESALEDFVAVVERMKSAEPSAIVPVERHVFAREADDRRLYLVRPWIEGEALADAREPPDGIELAATTAAFARWLAPLNSRGRVVGNLKPSNLVRVGGGAWRVVDTRAFEPPPDLTRPAKPSDEAAAHEDTARAFRPTSRRDATDDVASDAFALAVSLLSWFLAAPVAKSSDVTELSARIENGFFKHDAGENTVLRLQHIVREQGVGVDLLEVAKTSSREIADIQVSGGTLKVYVVVIATSFTALALSTTAYASPWYAALIPASATLIWLQRANARRSRRNRSIARR